MNEPDFHVQIPECFKEGFSRRFDPARAVLGDEWTIKEPCELCGEFWREMGRCKGCPFRPFRGGVLLGCVAWTKAILGTSPSFVCANKSVHWSEDRDTLAREQLARLRQRAEELIEWTEVEPKPRSEEMIVTATLAAKKVEKKPEQTLADLDDDVLAIVEAGGHPSHHRFRRGGVVYGLRSDRHGEVSRVGFYPRHYTIIEILGPLVFNFED